MKLVVSVFGINLCLLIFDIAVCIFLKRELFFFRMFYGPIVGGLLTQHLSFEWAAAVQGGLAFLAVSISLFSVQVFFNHEESCEKQKHEDFYCHLCSSFPYHPEPLSSTQPDAGDHALVVYYTGLYNVISVAEMA